MTEILELDPSLVDRITDDVLDGKHLPQDDARMMLHMLASPEIPDALKGAMLGAMRVKGATPDEVRGLAMAMQDIATPIPGDTLPDLIDTCGTGGDGSQSVNISTATALLAAACGLNVAKHGNVSVSSRSGSADVLRALGVPLPTSGAEARTQLESTGFAFLFAPAFHPATKGVGKVRREIGRRTVFNVLGPLTNPARPRFQLVGAYDPKVTRLMADALCGMDAERAFVVHGAPAWDEATPVGPFLRYDVRGDTVTEETIDPADVGIARCTQLQWGCMPYKMPGAAAREQQCGNTKHCIHGVV